MTMDSENSKANHMSDSTLDLFEAKADHEAEMAMWAKKYGVSLEYYKMEFDPT